MEGQMTSLLLHGESELLLLVDEENISFNIHHSMDLYEELIQEPNLAKHDSIKYDYQPHVPDLCHEK